MKITVKAINNAVKEADRLNDAVLIPLLFVVIFFALCLASIGATISIRITWELCLFIATN